MILAFLPLESVSESESLSLSSEYFLCFLLGKLRWFYCLLGVYEQITGWIKWKPLLPEKGRNHANKQGSFQLVPTA